MSNKKNKQYSSDSEQDSESDYESNSISQENSADSETDDESIEPITFENKVQFQENYSEKIRQKIELERRIWILKIYQLLGLDKN
ncbi:hypothetical protein M0811_08529 [Anaeramoeba ignava]|uniref:Uncharacterized protein n=1 Tax=Anaeramoeba ignava TaxID=1746090 RepID=A0A9Q0RB22_ANAIG|nr:hypothetical protein M0811_08529 [Anaeramoeba ignava]